MIKVLLKVTLAFIVLMVLFYLAIFGMLSFLEPCENRIIQSVFSPNKKYKVVLFQRDCGATTSFSSQISLLKSKEKLEDSGNIYIAKGYPKNFTIEWQDNNHIIITLPKQKVYKIKKELNSIVIEYKILGQ